MSLPWIKLFQTQDEVWVALASQRENWGKYRPLRTFAHKALGVWINLQANLARKASLKVSIFLKPSPPSSFFGFVIVENETHLTPLLPSSLLHQKRNIKDMSCWQKVVGCLKMVMAYVEHDWRTNIIRTSFPACDSDLSFQDTGEEAAFISSSYS